MAKIIEPERQDNQEVDEQDLLVQQEEQEEQATPEPQEPEIPDKYKGKTAEELVQMHQEAEKLLGRQSSEVGELRKVVDTYIQTQLTQEQQPAPQQDEEVDWFTDPDKAVDRAIQNHPKIKEAEELTKHIVQALHYQSYNVSTLICNRFCRILTLLSGSRHLMLGLSCL